MISCKTLHRYRKKKITSKCQLSCHYFLPKVEMYWGKKALFREVFSEVSTFTYK